MRMAELLGSSFILEFSLFPNVNPTLALFLLFFDEENIALNLVCAVDCARMVAPGGSPKGPPNQ